MLPESQADRVAYGRQSQRALVEQLGLGLVFDDGGEQQVRLYRLFAGGRELQHGEAIDEVRLGKPLELQQNEERRVWPEDPGIWSGLDNSQTVIPTRDSVQEKSSCLVDRLDRKVQLVGDIH